MTIAPVSNAAYAAATGAMPSHSTGNYIEATVWRNGSVTAPTIPAGWTLVKTQTGTTCWLGVYYKIAASSSEATGTWTSATSIELNVYSGVSGPGASAGGTGSGTTITYPALTLTKTNSTSWVSRVAAGKSMTNMLTNVPTGYTARGGISTPTGSAIRGCDSNAGLASSPGAGTQAVSPTGVWCAISVELKATVAPGPAFSTLADPFDTGSIPDVAKWSKFGTVTVSAGDVVVAASAELDSVATYSLTGDAAFIQARAVSTDTFYYVTDTALGLGFGWQFNSSSQAEASGLSGPTGITRTHTSGDWYRVRESGGTLFYDYSTDDTKTWTNAYSEAVAIADVGNLALQIIGGTGSSRFDNFNTVPAANTGAFFAMF